MNRTSNRGRGSSGATGSHAHKIWGALEASSNSTSNAQESSDSSREQPQLQSALANPEGQTESVAIAKLRAQLNVTRRQKWGKSLDGVLLVGDSSSSSKCSKDSQKASLISGDCGQDEDDDFVPGEENDFVDEEAHEWSELPRDALLELLPRDESGNATSIGSMHHQNATCSPCVFTQRARGCKQGIYCAFCHYPHPEHVEKKRNRQRPCKVQRMRFDAFINRLKEKCENNPDGFNADKVRLPPSVTKNASKAQRVMADLKDFQEQAKERKRRAQGGRRERESKLSL